MVLQIKVCQISWLAIIFKDFLHTLCQLPYQHCVASASKECQIFYFFELCIENIRHFVDCFLLQHKKLGVLVTDGCAVSIRLDEGHSVLHLWEQVTIPKVRAHCVRIEGHVASRVNSPILII